MIERYTLTSLDEVDNIFGHPVPAGSTPRFNIAPLQRALICTATRIAEARWGLLPPWRGHGGKRGPHVVHAPLAAIDHVPLLRNSFKSQRCLVIADGFYVWRRTGKRPAPIWIHPAPAAARPDRRTQAIAFAGVAATHRDDGQLSFAVIVGPVTPIVASALGPADDAGAPVVIPNDSYRRWLTGSREIALTLLTTAPAGWRAEPVSTWVSSVEHDDPKCVEPLGNPAQGELF